MYTHPENKRWSVTRSVSPVGTQYSVTRSRGATLPQVVRVCHFTALSSLSRHFSRDYRGMELRRIGPAAVG